MYYVYMIKNKINNQCYIGITNNPQRRKSQHWSPAVKHKIHLAMDQYGKENFIFQVIDKDEDKNQILELEEYYVSYYNSFHNGYNMTPGGEWNPSLFKEIVEKRTFKLLNDKTINEKLSHKEENHPLAKYTVQDVKDIRKRRMNGERGSEVYESYKHIDNNAGWRSGFSKIWLHESWTNICPEYIGKYPKIETSQYALRKRNQLSEVELEELKQQLKSNIKYNILFKKYKKQVDWNTFQKICKDIKNSL